MELSPICWGDWRIEQQMAKHFTGCKINFHWLINHIFYSQRKRNKKQPLQDALAEWLLLTMRSWDLEALKPQVNALEKYINITDGQPDQRENTIHTIEYADKLGIEIYGVGIPPCHVEDILPKRSISIESMEQLPQAMFGLLQAALTTQR